MIVHAGETTILDLYYRRISRTRLLIITRKSPNKNAEKNEETDFKKRPALLTPRHENIPALEREERCGKKKSSVSGDQPSRFRVNDNFAVTEIQL